jgi:hypothetical protein
VRGIADHCLVEIPDLDQNPAFRIGKGTEIADMTVAANPDGRTVRQFAAAAAVEPLVKLGGVATHIGVGRTRHLKIASMNQNSFAITGLYHSPLIANSNSAKQKQDQENDDNNT